jgi:hypothetical protein
MKQVIFILSLAFASTAFSQMGTWYVGGTAGFTSESEKTTFNGKSTDGPKSSSYSFSPEVGTWLSDKIQLGVGLGITGGTGEVLVNGIKTGELNLSGFGVNPYARYFFAGESFRPFVGVAIPVEFGNIKETPTGGKAEETPFQSFGANLNAGFGYFISPKWTVIGSFGVLGFDSTTSGKDDVAAGTTKTVTNSFGLDASTLGNRFTVGFYYTL